MRTGKTDPSNTRSSRHIAISAAQPVSVRRRRWAGNVRSVAGTIICLSLMWRINGRFDPLPSAELDA